MPRTEKERFEHYSPPEDAKTLPGVEHLISDMKEAVNLLDEGIELKESIEAQTIRLEEVKNKLLQIQVAHDFNGFRNGSIVFIGSYVKGRRQLNREMLLENGVMPETIRDSYKTGEASWRREIKRLE